METCPGCGVKTEQSAGSVHRCSESTPGCWALYGQLLAREYQSFEYMQVHSLTVDAYALQHPGQVSPQTNLSANIHLASLYSYFMLDFPVSRLPEVKGLLAERTIQYDWLQPPASQTGINVKSVLQSKNAAEHQAAVIKWSEYIFSVWKPHHTTAAGYLEQLGVK